MPSMLQMAKATRSTMLELDIDTKMMGMDQISIDFKEKFELREGDFLYVKKRGRAVRKPCRIMEVEDCYYNSRGGFTACLKAIPLLSDGSNGCVFRLYVCVNANGSGLRGALGHEVTRINAAKGD